MELNEIQQMVVKQYSQHQPQRNLHQRILTIMEELGELCWSILQKEGCHSGKPRTSIGEEMADIIANLLYLSEILGVNLQDEILKKFQQDNERFKFQ